MSLFYKLKLLLAPELAKIPILQANLEATLLNEEFLRVQVQRLQDIISNKQTILATTTDKLSITSHAIHRYRERHKGKGSDEDIYRMLYKCLLQQLATMDTLPDGKYCLKRGVYGVVKDNTLVTIVPKHNNVKPKLK